MDDPPNDVRLTDTQLGILVALCRPLAGGDHFATPATNQEIAEEVLLGVDAVEGHLRTLYREFGIEDLPHDQQRARLVEMAIAGGYLPPEGGATATEQSTAAEWTEAPAQVADGSGEPAPRPTGVPLESVEIRPRPARPPAKGKSGHSVGEYVTVIVLILVVLGGAFAISGIFGSSTKTPPPPTSAAFRAELAGDCKLALEDAPSTAGKDRAGQARGYLDVIQPLRGKFESLVQPTLPDIALERFSIGLTKAVKYTSDVAKGPPPAGSEAEAKNVAELTSAAKQVQAGAVGYGLGHECVEVGDLVARSAQNAAAP